MGRLTKTGFTCVYACSTVFVFTGPNRAVADLASSEATAGSELSEVVVTARRRSENLETTPISVTALTSQDLTSQQILDIHDVARETPNLVTAPAAATRNAALLSMRGQVQNDALITLDPSVGVYVDDVYMARAYSVLNNLLDVHDVEVLEGPQGTLYGRNTTGGAIKIETEKPGVNDGVNGFLTVGGGNYDAFDVSGAVTIPVVKDVLALRYAGAYETHDGYTKSYLVNQPNLTPVATIDTDNLNSYTHRLTVVFQPIESLSMELVGAYFQDIDHGSLAVNTTGDIETLIAPPPNFAFGFSNSPQRAASFYSGLTYVTPYDKSRNSTVTLNTRYDISDTLYTKVIVGYVNASNHSLENASGVVTPNVALVQFYPELNQNERQESGEWQIGGRAFEDRLNWVGGLYYFHETGYERSPATTTVFGFPDAVSFNGDADNRSRSGYADATWKWTDRIDTSVGLRYTNDSKGLVGENRDFSNICIYPAGGGVITSATPGGPCVLNRTDTFDYTTWEAGADYRFTNDIFGYVKAGDGFRSGGEQLRAVNAASAAPFQPEKAMNYEMGIKAEFFDHLARTNLAIYHTNYQDIQESIILSPPAYPTTTTQVINKGDAKVDGFEAQALVRPIANLTVSASAGYTNFRFADPTLQQVYTPRWTGAASAAYTEPTPLGDVIGRLDYNFRDSFVVGQPRELDSRLPSSSLLNARLSLDLKQGLEVSLYGKNLTRQQYFTGGLQSGNVLAASLGAPRTYGAEATYRFGKQ